MSKKKAKQVEPGGRFFIVNKAGAIHEVTKEDAEWRLNMVGFRAATVEEVKEYLARGGKQTADDPICEPWEPVAKAVELTELDLSGLGEQ